MADQALQLMTVDEFLAWDDGTDTRYELSDGVVRAMSPPSNAHGTIAGNASLAIGTVLRSKRPCRFQPDAGVRIDQTTWWQADIAVRCSPITSGGEIDQPVLIVEVLSPSTRTHDLGEKLVDYKTLPSVTEIWMIDSVRRWVQHWRRDQSGWIGQDFVGSSAFDSPMLGARVTLDELYDGAEL
ncbi:MAG: Uma2 family endonuclease [Geminicoccaceae bacterium]